MSGDGLGGLMFGVLSGFLLHCAVESVYYRMEYAWFFGVGAAFCAILSAAAISEVERKSE